MTKRLKFKRKKAAKVIKAAEFYIGVDVGGTKISAAIVDPYGGILVHRKYPTIRTAKPALVGRQIEGIIKEVLSDGEVSAGAVKGIGVGVPGIVHPRSNKILVTPNIALAGYPLYRRLKKLFKTKVVLGNDVNLGTLAEKWLGAGKKADNIIGIFLGTGVGGGIIIDGKVYTGAQGAGGELGHMIIDLHNPASSAGVAGTLEALTGRRAIERAIREAIRMKRKTIVTELTGGNLKVIKSKVIKKALKSKDRVVTEIMNNVCLIIGKACVSLRHIFNPDMIILGGGIMEACGDFILPRVQKVFRKDPFMAGVDQCEVTQSILADDAVILGAVALVKQGR